MTAPLEALVAGCGAIGSRLEAACDLAVAITCADRERVAPENLGVAAFAAGDLGRDKAGVVAARRRARGGIGRALGGDVCYTVRPGLVRALGAVLVCLDNPTAVRDLVEAVWDAGTTDVPVFVLTCGGETGGWQVRLFVPPGPCPVCLWGDAERRADRLALGASCDTTAPRAAVVAAEEAAKAGARLLARWRAGERALANRRVQSDGPAGEYVVRMPEAPATACPVRHRRPAECVRDLGVGADAITVGELAARALEAVGDDAELFLGRRGVPLAGLYCPRCRAVAPTELCLLPAAGAAARPCGCGEPLRPLGERSTVGARELAAAGVARWTLAAWGAGAGDELVFAGARGRVRFRTAFDWKDVDG